MKRLLRLDDFDEFMFRLCVLIFLLIAVLPIVDPTLAHELIHSP